MRIFSKNIGLKNVKASPLQDIGSSMGNREQKSGWESFNQNLSSSSNSISNVFDAFSSGTSQVANAVNQINPRATMNFGLDSKTLLIIGALILLIFRKKIF